ITVSDQDVAGVVWEADAGATLRGKVTTRSGEPVVGARVTSHPRLNDRGLDTRTVWSEHDGSYELRGLRSGTHQIDVSSPRAPAPGNGFQIEIASGAVVQRDLVLDDGGTVTGVFVDPDGKPVIGIRIALVPATGESSRLRECRSDDAGAFACDA